MPRTKQNILNKTGSNLSLLQRIQPKIDGNQSYLSLFLALLIVLTAGILVFNYFKKNQADLGPAQTISKSENQDVKTSELPGKYTVKEGDTLFKISEKYYNDGYQFIRIAESNRLANVDAIEVGQVLEIPKVEKVVAEFGTGGAVNETIWGEKITGDTYTVVTDDWLSKIAGRAYGDIKAYEKIAKANNISNADLIEPGTVLTIPR